MNGSRACKRVLLAVGLAAAAAASAVAQDTPGEHKRRLANEMMAAYTGDIVMPSPLGGRSCGVLIDNFEDGDTAGWAPFSFTPGDSSAYADGGRLILERAPGGDANPFQYYGLTWADSIDDVETYYDGALRLTFRITDPGTTFLAFGRGFFAQFVVQPWDGQYYLLINAAETWFNYTGLSHTPFDLEIGEEYVLEGTFVGPDLSMKVWKLSEEEPAEPQLVATSPQWGDPYIRYGRIGVEIDGFWQTDARGVEIDDITFCPKDAEDPPAVDPNSIPVTGIPVPRLAVIDDMTRQYMAETGAKSFVHSWMKDGKVQFHRAYGWADEAKTEVLQPDAMMRLASISKPFTAAAIRELVADHKLRMDDKAFDLGQPGGGILDIDPYPTLGDERYKDITIQHLIEHTSGWDRGVYGDIFWGDFEAARVLGVPMPISREDRIRFLLSTPLQYDPGSPGVVDSYSNTAYEVLGLIVERVSGMDFDEYVRLAVLPTIEVSESETELGRSFPDDFNPREPFYDSVSFSPNVFDQFGPWARLPYGGWNNESYSPVAGRIASGSALMNLAHHRYLFGPKAGKELAQRVKPHFYDFHNGALPGTDADLLHSGNLIGSVLSNHQFYGEYFPSVHPGPKFYTEFVLTGLADWPSRKSGDMDCNGRVNVHDVTPFFLAVQDIDAYAEAYPGCTGFNADINGDLVVDVNDIAGFLECLHNRGCEH